MRHTLFTLMFVLLMVPQALAQETQTPTTETKPKNAVDKMHEEATERGETVIDTCITDDCPKDAPKIEGLQPGRALRMPTPTYPAIARAANAQGDVEVKVMINEEGMVIAAASISGHPLLQAAAVSAARDAQFTPTLLQGKAVKVVGVIKYVFVQ
ncbi:MAG TPA: TonB family protein [Pyrinomonadaceae bacterium]|nr:TonB family protein [Pyrinomonadaceae bacterium]